MPPGSCILFSVALLSEINRTMFFVMQRFISLCFFSLVALVLSGCATIVSGTKYPVRISSTPSQAKFVVKNATGNVIYSGQTPQTLTLESGTGFSASSYTIGFEKSGYEKTSYTLNSTIDNWVVGDIFFGLLGVIIDLGTGAAWELPPSVHANLEKNVNTSSPQEKAPPSNDITNEIGAWGSGFAVSPTIIFTANHVIENAKKIWIRFPGSTWQEAQLVAFSQNLDSAVLRINPQKKCKFFLPIHTRKISEGDKVFTFGYPMVKVLGEAAKYSEGVIASTSGLQGDNSLIQCSVPVQPGNSGGPLLNEKGEVIGIISSTAAPWNWAQITEGALPQNVNWAVNINYVLPLLPEKTVTTGSASLSHSEIIRRSKNATCLIKVVY